MQTCGYNINVYLSATENSWFSSILCKFFLNVIKHDLICNADTIVTIYTKFTFGAHRIPFCLLVHYVLFKCYKSAVSIFYSSGQSHEKHFCCRSFLPDDKMRHSNQMQLRLADSNNNSFCFCFLRSFRFRRTITSPQSN